MNPREQKQLISDLATSPGFIQAIVAGARNIDESRAKGKELDYHAIALWFYSSGYMDCLDYQKKKRITRPYKHDVRDEINKIKNK